MSMKWVAARAHAARTAARLGAAVLLAVASAHCGGGSEEGRRSIPSPGSPETAIEEMQEACPAAFRPAGPNVVDFGQVKLHPAFWDDAGHALGFQFSTVTGSYHAKLWIETSLPAGTEIRLSATSAADKSRVRFEGYVPPNAYGSENEPTEQLVLRVPDGSGPFGFPGALVADRLGKFTLTIESNAGKSDLMVVFCEVTP